MALVYSSSPMSVLPEDSEDTPAAKKQTSSDAVDKGKQQLVPPPQTKVAVVVVDEPSTPPLPIKQKPTPDDDGNLRGAESSSEASSSQKSLLDADNDAEEVPRTSSDSERGGHFSVFGGLSDSPPPSVRPEQAGGAVPMPTLPESLSSERLAEKEANDDDDDDDDENEASPSSPPSSSTQPTSPAVNSPTKKPNLSLFQKTLELTAGDEHIKELEESECCSICLDDFTDDDPAKVTLCGHRYHLQCVMQWRQRSDECPMCLRTLRWVDTETEELVEALAQPEFVVGSAPDYTTDRSTGYALMAAYASSRPRSLTTTTATTRAAPSRGAFAATLGIPQRRATETAAPSSSSSLSSSAPAKGFFGKMSAMFRSRR